MPTQKPPRVHCYVVRGQFDWAFSQGIDALCLRLRTRPNVVEASIWNWYNQAALVNAIKNAPLGDEIVIIGYSLGATYAPRIARLTKRLIELLIGFDPSQKYLMEAIPDNVKKAIAFYNPNAWYFGGQKYWNGGNVVNIPVSDMHLFIDWDQGAWARTFKEVNQVSA